MKYSIFDVETTTSNSGNPFDQTNKLVCAGVLSNGKSLTYYDKFNEIDNTLQGSDLAVGFNLKFDLHWWRRMGFKYPKSIWDCQLAEFLLSYQENKYPSLDETLEKYGYPPKLDVVKNEYWDKGIDTDKVPREILSEYLATDLIRTEQVFKRQYHMFQSQQYKHLYKLFRLQCQDLLVLADMEYNGVVFNTEKARAKASEIQTEQDEILVHLRKFFGDIPFNITSDYHLSALLYGGVILEECRIPVGLYKTGAKTGQVRYKVEYIAYECPRLVEPLKGTESHEKVSKKELEFVQKGVLTEPRKYWTVNEETLLQLKIKGKGKAIIESVIRYNKLDKLKSTYLLGWSKLIDEMNWEKDMIHSQLNQTLVVTGRLSSSKPNGQNADKLTKLFCESRYE